MKSQGLTVRQQHFVAEYLLDGNGARSAIAAGYGVAGARVRAHRLTQDNQAVKAAIQARQAQDSQRLQIERQDVIKAFLEAFEMARERQEPSTMVSAARELGRLLGLYEPKQVRIEAMVSGAAKFETMSDAELMAVVAGGGSAKD